MNNVFHSRLCGYVRVCSRFAYVFKHKRYINIIIVVVVVLVVAVVAYGVYDAFNTIYFLLLLLLLLFFNELSLTFSF